MDAEPDNQNAGEDAGEDAGENELWVARLALLGMTLEFEMGFYWAYNIDNSGKHIISLGYHLPGVAKKAIERMQYIEAEKMR